MGLVLDGNTVVSKQVKLSEKPGFLKKPGFLTGVVFK
jgi:hypothetical protein